MTSNDVTEEIRVNMHRYYQREVLDGTPGQRVINKNCHLINKLSYLLGIFPDAKVIHIIRDCEQVVASWLAMMDSHPTVMAYLPRDERFPCIWFLEKPVDTAISATFSRHPDFYPGIGEDIFVDLWVKANLGVLEQMNDCQTQLLQVRYEELVRNPAGILAKINQFCELPDFDYSVMHIKSDTALRHKSRISDQLRKLIEARAGPARHRFGFN